MYYHSMNDTYVQQRNLGNMISNHTVEYLYHVSVQQE